MSGGAESRPEGAEAAGAAPGSISGAAGWAPRRFWREARAAPVADTAGFGEADRPGVGVGIPDSDGTDGAGDGGAGRPSLWQVLLDGRPLRTPGKTPVLLPGRALAELVAAEWQAVEEVVRPQAMPATRMANAALDKVAPQRVEVAALLASYGETDLLCYRATTPLALAQRQLAWDGPLDWAVHALGARLTVTSGVMPQPQPPEAVARLAGAVHALPPFELAPFHDLVTLSGSLVLALAVAAGALPAGEAWALSRLDEDYQRELWGADAEADARAAAREAGFLFALRFLQHARAGASGAAPGGPGPA